jgi:TonB-linked SusC/RagA family outer membrane protein
VVQKLGSITVDLDRSVTLSVKDKKIDEILDMLFAGTDVVYTITDRKIILAPSFLTEDAQQQRSVSGKVTDSSGQPLPGVTVVVKGTNTGTVTNADGDYTLTNLPEDATLVFSFVGMRTQEMIVGNQDNINIILYEDTRALDEVVVIGYGTVKKSDLTGSVSSVKSEELTAIPQGSVAQAMQGRSAGIHVKQTSGAPGSAVTVRVRGTNSILGDNNPLYVIDGFPSYSSDLGMLNVADIESIEILKDASAIAIYGSRGSNGVIMITTKKGKTGKTKVDFGTTMGYQSLNKKMEMMNAREYCTFYNEYGIIEGVGEHFTESQINEFGEGFDWQDFIFTTAPIRTHSLAVSGGNEKTQFNVSGNIFDQQGIVGAGGYSRYSLRTNLDHEINKRLNVNFYSTLSRNINDNKTSEGGRQGGTLISGALLSPPILTPYNDDGTYRVLDNSYPVISTGGGLINPLNILNERSNITKSNRILANLSLTYEPVDGLFIKILGGVENTDSRNDYYQTLKYINSLGSASVSTSNSISFLNENTVSYIKTFAQKHNISAVAGLTYQDYTYKNLGGSGTGFLSDITKTGNLGSAATPGVPSSSYSKWVLLSSIARVNYNFDQRYLFTISFRSDGSSKYSRGNKWGYFPSGALAWRISEEQFMEKVSLISDLKLRASYGVSGSQAISPYSTMNNLYTGKTVFGSDRYTTFAPSTSLPGDLKWESTGQFDLGIDVGIVDNRFRFTADYYIKKTKDLLNSIPLATSTGYTQTIGNVGEIQNKGFEFSIDARAIDREFQWDLNGNISFNRSMVKKLYGGEDILGGAIDFLVVVDNCSVLREGEPMGIFYGYLQDGYDDKGIEIYKDLEPDGVMNQLDKTKIGDPNPDFIYGLNSHMSYKNFDFSFFIQGSQGNDLLNASGVDNSLLWTYGVNLQKDVLYDHWTPENPNAKYPIPKRAHALRFSNRFIEDGSYLRLKNVELGYNLPVQYISWLDKVRLYVSLQNILTITNYSGWDPDVNSQGGGIGQGIDHNPYPVAKSYTFGINVTL